MKTLFNDLLASLCTINCLMAFRACLFLQLCNDVVTCAAKDTIYATISHRLSMQRIVSSLSASFVPDADQ